MDVCQSGSLDGMLYIRDNYHIGFRWISQVVIRGQCPLKTDSFMNFSNLDFMKLGKIENSILRVNLSTS
jgi:hypothetical protein